MNTYRMVVRVSATCAIGAAVALSPGIAAAGPPIPFPTVVQFLGCGQQFPFTLTFVTAESGPPIAQGQLRIEAKPAVPWAAGASRLSVGWFNTNTLQSGFAGLDGPLPVLSKTIATGTGRIVVTMLPPLDGGICQGNSTIGIFDV